LFCKNDQKRRLKEAKIDKLKVVFFWNSGWIQFKNDRWIKF
jgi:hypothetical protein